MMNTTPLRTTDTVDIRQLLCGDHEIIERTFRDLLEALKAGDRDEARCLWGVLDRRLVTHMSAEEDYAFPVFAEVDAAEVAALRADHDALRKQIDELGVGVDLHAVSPTLAQSFAEALRRHAQREDTLLYRWLAQSAEAGTIGPLAKRVQDTARS